MFDIFNKKVVDFNDAKKKPTKKSDKSIDTVKKYIDEAIKKTNRNTSQLIFTQSSKIRKEKNTIIFEISGGLNGAGKWSNYFTDLSTFTKYLESKAKDIFLTKIECDCVDDIFFAEFAFQMKEKV